MTLWALGALPETIHAQHTRNTLYQRQPPKVQDDAVVVDMANPQSFKRYLGIEDHYLDFVHFCEQEIDDLGYPAVLQKYLLGRNEVGDDMLPRMYMGELSIWMTKGRSKRSTDNNRLRSLGHACRNSSSVQATRYYGGRICTSGCTP